MIIAGLRTTGIVAPSLIDCAVNRDLFETWVEKVLKPELKPGDLVVIDNLSSHKGPRERALIEGAGTCVTYLPPYSPDFNPIENAFAKLEALLRKAAARTQEAFWEEIGQLVECITPADCTNMLAASGYPD